MQKKKWIESNWIKFESNQTELDLIKLNWIELNRTESNQIEPNQIKLNQIELNQMKFNSIESNRTALNRITGSLRVRVSQPSVTTTLTLVNHGRLQADANRKGHAALFLQPRHATHFHSKCISWKSFLASRASEGACNNGRPTLKKSCLTGKNRTWLN